MLEVFGVFEVRQACARGIFARHTYAKNIHSKNAYFKGICIKDASIDIRNLIIWNSWIYNSANNSYKSAIVDPKLPVNLKLMILVSFSLYLQVILYSLL